MDVNYLFLRQQVERSLAETAVSAAARQAHEDLARAYELQIERKSGGRILFDRRNEDRASVEQEMLIIGLSSPSATS